LDCSANAEAQAFIWPSVVDPDARDSRLWRHVTKRFPLTYSPLYWGAVFALGTYTVCTLRLYELTGVRLLHPLPRLFVTISVAAWPAAFAACSEASRAAEEDVTARWSQARKTP
jgi:tellurite resistance protein TehA-like permease